MSRRKILSDTEVLLTVWSMMVQNPLDPPSFGQVSLAVGLSAPTLVQRFGNRHAMLERAVQAAWERLIRTTQQIADDSLNSPKGAQSMLKSLILLENIPTLLAQSTAFASCLLLASQWRLMVEAEIALRFKQSGTRAKEIGGRVFAIWQGRLLWENAGGKTFRLGEAVRDLSD
jgi:AcrR family transcriptional regulator